MPRGRPKRETNPRALGRLEALIASSGGQSRAAELLGVHPSTLSRTRKSRRVSRELAEALEHRGKRNAQTSRTKTTSHPSAKPPGQLKSIDHVLLLLQEICRILPEALTEQNR